MSASENKAGANDVGELAVRKYLEFVRDPATARDDAAISSTQAELQRTTDVLDRVRLLSKLERLEQADGEALRQGFVKHARLWSAVNHATVAAFRGLGVNDIVLAEAGFDLGRGKRAGGKSKAASGGIRRPRAESVSSASIRQWALSQPGSFTMAEVMAGAGGSLMTVKKVTSEMVSAHELRSLGQIANPGVRGRAPERFEKA
jgi:hypothetical protein